MLIVVSPAKSLDYESKVSTRKFTQPRFLEESEQLVQSLRKLAPDDLSELMNISESLAEENYQRYANWQTPFDRKNARQAIFAFKGDVYLGLQAEQFSTADLNFAQKHLRILSGLYGLLRPLDLMQPYRLEMGLPFENAGGKNLYEFWGDQITKTLGKHLKASGSPVLVNLASNEYFKAVKPKLLDADVITPQFRDLKNGQYKMISFFAKKARGLMARYIIQEGLTDPARLKRFKGEGYYYSADHSEGNTWVFLRDAPPQG